MRSTGELGSSDQRSVLVSVCDDVNLLNQNNLFRGVYENVVNMLGDRQARSGSKTLLVSGAGKCLRICESWRENV